SRPVPDPCKAPQERSEGLFAVVGNPGAEGRWFSGVARRRPGTVAEEVAEEIAREARRETLGAAEGMSDATGVGVTRRGVLRGPFLSAPGRSRSLGFR